jgi:hypothetical protein
MMILTGSNLNGAVDRTAKGVGAAVSLRGVRLITILEKSDFAACLSFPLAAEGKVD